MNSRHTWHGDVAGLAGVSKNNGLSLMCVFVALEQKKAHSLLIADLYGPNNLSMAKNCPFSELY